MTLHELLQLVQKQSEDLGLWGIAQSPEEEYLQMALKEIHWEIERYAGMVEDGVE